MKLTQAGQQEVKRGKTLGVDTMNQLEASSIVKSAAQSVSKTASKPNDAERQPVFRLR